MSIGVDFTLRANSAAFTRALSSANNSVKDLKKSFREFDVGNGFKQALGVGGIIAGFKAVIGHARETRDELDKMGKPVESATRSVAEFGDAFAGVVTKAKDAGVSILSVFTKVGDGIRHITQQTSAEQEEHYRKMVQSTGKAADEAEARLKKSQEANSPEKQAEAQAKLDKAEQESTYKGTADEKKLVGLINERYELEQKLKKTPGETVEAKNIRAQIIQNETASKEIEARQAAEIAKQQKEKADKVKEEAAKLTKQFAPSVEELAKQELGGFFTANDPRLQARKAMKDEELARTLFARGDYKGGLEAAKGAQATRTALENRTGEGGPLTQKTAEDAFKAGLSETNTKLEELTKAVSGIIKAQK